MICQPCRDSEHQGCPGGTHCACQHKVGRTPVDSQTADPKDC